MCLRIEEYECGHTYKSVRYCKRFLDRKAAQKQETRGFWKSIFKRKTKLVCDEPAGRRKRLQPCPSCAVKWEREQAEVEAAKRALYRARERTRQREEKEAAWRKQERDRTKEEENARLTFRCSACRREGRYPTDRRGNNGLCCARGLEEYDKPRGTYRASASASRHNTDPGHARGHEDLSARAKATQAAEEYGWVPMKYDCRQSIEPHLVAAVGNQPGSTLKPLPPLPPPPVVTHETFPWDISVPPSLYPMKGCHEDASINFDRWREISQSANHGTVPPPPERPLPTRPLGSGSQDPFGKQKSAAKASQNEYHNTAQSLSTGTQYQPEAERRTRTEEEDFQQARRISHTIEQMRLARESAGRTTSGEQGRDLITRYRNWEPDDKGLKVLKNPSPVSSLSSQSACFPTKLSLEIDKASRDMAGGPMEYLIDAVDEASDAWEGFSDPGSP